MQKPPSLAWLAALLLSVLHLNRAAAVELPYGRNNPVIYVNDGNWDVYTQEYLMALARNGEINLRGMIASGANHPNWTGTPYSWSHNGTQDQELVNAAKQSGWNIADMVRGTERNLVKPSSGVISATASIGSPGTTLILNEARAASAATPLLIICGGPITNIVDAWLLDNSIADKIVVAWLAYSPVNQWGPEGSPDANVEMDTWAATIALQKLKLVIFPVNRDEPYTPKSRMYNELADNPLRAKMVAKTPYTPDYDADGQPAVSIMVGNTYVATAKRVAYNPNGTGGFGAPLLRDDAAGPHLYMLDGNQQAGSDEWWRAVKKAFAGGAPADTQAPTTPTGLSSPGKTSSSVSLSWSPSTDNVGVTGYEVFIGTSTTAAATSTSTSATVTGLSASTTYSFTVKARDGAGNRSAASAALSVTTSATTTPPTGSNLALNKPAYSSANENTSLVPANAFDGNVGTRWASPWSDPHWIYVDLGAAYSLSRVVLKWEGAYGKAYQIQTSNDATNWTTLFSTTTGDGGTDDLTGLSGTGRYVRMYGMVRGTVYCFSLWEFEVYGTATTTPTPTPGTFSGTYKITARHSGKALDVNAGATTDGANVQQWTANGTGAQQWIITATTDGYYKLVCKASGKALEVAGSSLADGGNVQQWTYSGANNQQWKIEATTDGYYKLTARHSGKVLDVANASLADGGNVHQWGYGGGTNQQWKVEQISTATTRQSFEGTADAGVRVYPNPVSNGVKRLSIRTNEAETAQLVLSNGRGGTLIGETLHLQPGDNRVNVPLGGLPAGLYLLRVQRGTHHVVQKVVVR